MTEQTHYAAELSEEARILLAHDALDFNAGDWEPEHQVRHLKEQIEMALRHLKTIISRNTGPGPLAEDLKLVQAENLEFRKAFHGSNPFFVFDDQGVFEEFKTLKERDSYASDAIQSCLHDNWDEGVTNIVAGVITARTKQTNVRQRPDNLDENGCDEDGHCWDESWSHTCNYELIPIQHENTSADSEPTHG